MLHYRIIRRFVGQLARRILSLYVNENHFFLNYIIFHFFNILLVYSADMYGIYV
jgi:hypothetical protein